MQYLLVRPSVERCAIGVAWGFGSHEELSSSGAERIVESPAELASLAGP